MTTGLVCNPFRGRSASLAPSHPGSCFSRGGSPDSRPPPVGRNTGLMALVPDVTPKLDDFLREYEQDDNCWWRLACGHHMNLFEEAVDRMRSAERRLASQSAEQTS